MAVKWWSSTLFVLLAVFNNKHVSSDGLPPTCDSEVYCYGDLLHVVQTAGIFPDSKTFVDMSMLREPRHILDDFERLLAENNGNLTKQQVSSKFSSRAKLQTKCA